MIRVGMVLVTTVVMALASVGCCSKCGSCGSGCGKKCGPYWRNLGLPGKHAVGKSWCRKCDLCEDVGGPCGGWAQTSMAGPEGYYEGPVDQYYPEEEVLPPVSRQRGPVMSGRIRVAPTYRSTRAYDQRRY